MKVLKTYSDGSQMTTNHVAGLFAYSVIITPVIVYCVMKYDDWKTQRIMKAHNWPK